MKKKHAMIQEAASPVLPVLLSFLIYDLAHE